MLSKTLIKFSLIFKKEFKNIFFMLLSSLFFILDLVVTKKKNLIVFAQKNNLYSDNSKAFFEHVLVNSNYYKPVWLAHNYETYLKIKKENKRANVKILHSINGLRTLLIAKTVVVSNSLHDFFPNFKPSLRKEAIQLWHGIKWSKKFEYPNNNFTDDLTIICASSNSHKELIFKNNFLNPQRVYITGLPRNDKFFLNSKKKMKDNFLNDLKFSNKKIILYAPTHKEDLVSSFFPFSDLNFKVLEDFLIKNNFIIYLRPHINDTNKNKEWKNYVRNLNSKTIFSLSFNELEDINSFLPIVDILITDYSTIYTDALLFDIPTIFIPYDYEDYNKKRGFVYKFNEIAIGPKVYNQEELLTSLKNINENKTRYINEQRLIKNKFHKFEDGNSSKRILDILSYRIGVNNK